MKKILFIALAAALLVLAGTTAAFANYGPHGSYAQDTDACAECHRAHTATSQVTWTDNQLGQRNALLISDALTMTEFCYACHGDGQPGANTDVRSGLYDGDPTGTNSSADATLNGGGFVNIGGLSGAGGSPVMSSHGVDGLGGDDFIRWGYVASGVSVTATMTAFTCTDCHDPHGSTNYRLLKDVTNGVATGGYEGVDNTPKPWVISNEEGYPSGGWQKGDAGKTQMAIYKPSYTNAQYANAAQGTGKTMSDWCASCHTVYSQWAETGTGAAKSAPKWDYAGLDPQGVGMPGATDAIHRHPINVSFKEGSDPDAEDRALITQLVDDPGLPLENPNGLHNPDFVYGSTTQGQTQLWDENGYIGCLTCHRAHGTDAEMSGWAATTLGADGLPKTASPTTTTPAADSDGVNPTFDSALLRYDNRGVCERCHNK